MRRRDFGSTTDLPSASTKASLRFHYALVFGSTETRAHVRLLGPCFKTGRMESQPNSPQTPTRTAELRRRQDADTGNARQGTRRAQTASRAPTPLPSPRLTGSPTQAPDSTERYASDTTVGGQTTAHPKGLKQNTLRGARPVPTCPPRRPRTTQCRPTGKHNPGAARKPLTIFRQVATSYWGSHTSADAGTTRRADDDSRRQSIPKETAAKLPPARR